MKKQTRVQVHSFLAASVSILALAGSMVMAVPGQAAKPGKTQKHSQKHAHKQTLAQKHTLAYAKPAGIAKISGNIQSNLPAPRSAASHSAGAGASPLRLTPEQMKDFNAALIRIDKSVDIAKAGDADAELHNWSLAAISYQEALDLWPDNAEALYGLGQCAAAMGDLTQALSDYRLVIYAKAPGYSGMVPGSNFQTNDVERLMQFVLLLCRAGQAAEGVLVYNRAAFLLDYEGETVPVLKVLLPELAMEPTQPGQVQYTPQRLQALADTALSREGFDYKQEQAHTQEAVSLYPDSAVTHYYRGEALFGPLHSAAAKAEYQKAVELGDDQTAAAAKERLIQLP